MSNSTNFGSETSAEEVAAHFKDQIKGKVVLITGVTLGGLGGESARVIAAHEPKLIILAGRNEASLKEVSEAIKKEAADVKLQTLILDLGSIASVRKAAEQVLALPDKIDVLINNAGVMAGPYRRTSDGFELMFGVNHLGHFLFTTSIKSHLAKDGRIVNVSSYGHNICDVQWSDIGFSEGETFDQWKAYGQSKTANVLFSVGIMNKWGKEGITSVAVHPGVVGTNLSNHLSVKDFVEVGIFNEDGTPVDPRFKYKTLSQGTATHIVAAFDPSLSTQAPVYLSDCKVYTGPDLKEYAMDKGSADRLWEVSEKMIADKSQA